MGTTESWGAYVSWLERHVPFAYENLAPPASEAKLAEVEQVIGAALPEALKALWRMNNGQLKTMHASSAGHAIVCIPTLSFLSTDLVIQIWRDWEGVRSGAEIEELQSCGSSLEEGVVQPLYTHPGWIPLWSDPGCADYIGIDLAPGPQGKVGQIISFGRDEEAHYSPAASLDELLGILLTEVESGRWQASEREGDEPGPWFGDPESNFFNTLHAYWRKRMPRSAEDAVREANDAAKAKDHELVLRLVDEAIALGPAKVRMFELRADACEELERYAEADEAWRRACELKPTKGDSSYRRAQNQIYNLARYPEAETTLREAVALFPKSTRHAHLLAQAVGYFQHRFAESLPLWERTCALSVSDASDCGNYAYALAAAGKIPEAVARAKQALELNEDEDAALAVEQTFYLYALGDSSERAAWLRKLRALIAEGESTEDWDLSPVIATASAMGHPEQTWLEPLSRVANGVDDAEALAGWDAWSAASGD